MAVVSTLSAERLPRIDAAALAVALGPLNVIGSFQYSVVDAASGMVLRTGEASSIHSMLAQVHPERGEELAYGHPEPVDVPEVTERDIKRYAKGLIEERYKTHDQIEILGSGDEDKITEMRAFIAHIVERSRAVRAIDPLPEDYRNTEYWK
jgi:hypothetical protein